MGTIVAGMASSHAAALEDPAEWDARLVRNRGTYKVRWGVEPPIHPKVAEEPLDARRPRYARVEAGLNFLRERLAEKKPDALLLIGDDQTENFKEDNLPQIAIHLGDEVVPRPHGDHQNGHPYPCHADLAHSLLDGLVDREFDVSFSKSLPGGQLLSHAHGPILTRMVPEADIPVVLLFVNAFHVPAVSPNRCYRLGQAIREIVQQRPAGERIAIYASGGLSHFIAGYPWPFCKGPYTWGCIAEEFDRSALDLMARGEGEQLARLTSQDLLDNGDIEMRSWIVLLGALGAVPAQLLAYEALYSARMGMGVAYWEAETTPTTTGA